CTQLIAKTGRGDAENGLGQATWIKWVVLQTFRTIFYYIAISLFYDCEEMLCLCLGVCLVIVYCLVFVSTPVCENGAGRQVYICSLFCLVQDSSLVRYVLLCRLFYC